MELSPQYNADAISRQGVHDHTDVRDVEFLRRDEGLIDEGFAQLSRIVFERAKEMLAAVRKELDESASERFPHSNTNEQVIEVLKN